MRFLDSHQMRIILTGMQVKLKPFLLQMLFRWSDARSANFARMMIFAQDEGFLANLCQMTDFVIRGKGRSNQMSFKATIIACLVSALAGFAVGYYTGGEYMRRIFMRLNRRLTDEEIRKFQEKIYGKE